MFFEIIDDPELTARQLSADLDIDEGQISRILKRYIDMGWLTRKRSADDARRKQIEITSEGRKLYETLNARADEKTLLRLRGADPAAVANAMGGILDLLRPTEQTGVCIRDISFGDPGFSPEFQYSSSTSWPLSFEPKTLPANAASSRTETVTDLEASSAWRLTSQISLSFAFSSSNRPPEASDLGDASWTTASRSRVVRAMNA